MASCAFLLPFATDSELRKQYLQGAKSSGNCAFEKFSVLASSGLLRMGRNTRADPISRYIAQGLGTCLYFLSWALWWIDYVDGCSQWPPCMSCNFYVTSDVAQNPPPWNTAPGYSDYAKWRIREMTGAERALWLPPCPLRQVIRSFCTNPRGKKHPYLCRWRIAGRIWMNKLAKFPQVN